jgi:hypothetical protein
MGLFLGLRKKFVALTKMMSGLEIFYGGAPIHSYYLNLIISKYTLKLAYTSLSYL